VKLVRCSRFVPVGGKRVWRGCGLVWDGDRWREHEPGEDAESGALCGSKNGGSGCGKRLEQEQRKALVRIERKTERRAARGFGPAPEGVDPFRGFREGK
jgi:hypothetical protein